MCEYDSGPTVTLPNQSMTYFANVIGHRWTAAARSSDALHVEQAEAFLALQLRYCAHGQNALDRARFASETTTRGNAAGQARGQMCSRRGKVRVVLGTNDG